MSINMLQLIFQRAESAPPLPSQMSQAALSGGQFLGEGGLLLGGGIPGFPPPCMKPCSVIYEVYFRRGVPYYYTGLIHVFILSSLIRGVFRGGGGGGPSDLSCPPFPGDSSHAN